MVPSRPRPPSRCPKCQAQVLWWQNANQPGRRLPVDPSSDPDSGTVRKTVHEVDADTAAVIGRVLSGAELADAIASNEMLFTLHSASCTALRRHNPKPAGLTIPKPPGHNRGRR